MEMDAGGDEHVSELQCDHVEGDDQDGVPRSKVTVSGAQEAFANDEDSTSLPTEEEDH